MHCTEFANLALKVINTGTLTQFMYNKPDKFNEYMLRSDFVKFATSLLDTDTLVQLLNEEPEKHFKTITDNDFAGLFARDTDAFSKLNPKSADLVIRYCLENRYVMDSVIRAYRQGSMKDLISAHKNDIVIKSEHYDYIRGSCASRGMDHRDYTEDTKYLHEFL